MRDLHHNIGVAEAIPAAAYDADNTPATVDLAGFESAAIVLAIAPAASPSRPRTRSSSS